MSFRTDKYGHGYGVVLRCGAVAFMCIWFAVGQTLGQAQPIPPRPVTPAQGHRSGDTAKPVLPPFGASAQ